MTPHGNIAECSAYMAELEPQRRAILFERLFKERMNSKQRVITETFKSAGEEWNQTLYTTLLKYLGSTHNGAAMEQLSKIVSYNMLAKESGELRTLEALLLGGAGLLDLYPEDGYIKMLKLEFSHLAAKYSITPMNAEVWRLQNIYPNTHPTLRLVQFAASMYRQSISFSEAMKCHTRKDVHGLFSGCASEYWLDNFYLGTTKHEASARIGSFTSDLLGINVIIPTLIANGLYMDDARLIRQAMELAQSIPTEQNRYINMWQRGSAPISISAIDSQALLHLSRTYCENGACDKCWLYRIDAIRR
jgi:hypothetical protein